MGAAMNAILTFPTVLAAELQQLRSEVACHRAAIDLDAAAFEQSRSAWVSRETDLSRRMNTLRQRLALLA